jgi:predicted TPR repeat methyltransferase
VAAQDSGDLTGAAEAYEKALALDPKLGEAAFNLGTVRQETGDVAGARRAYGVAARLRPDGFGRAAQALSAASVGELWLDLGALRRSLDETAG